MSRQSTLKFGTKFVCDECGFSTAIKNRLVDHVNSVHLKINDKPSENQSEDTSPVPPLTPKPKPSKAKRKAEMASLSPTTPKRINLSIEGKREIIMKYDTLPKMSQESAAKELKIPRMTLRNILSKREAIIAAPKSDIKRSRVGKDAMVEDSLIKWFDMVIEKNANITHEILRDKAEDLAKKLGHDEFKASSGWLSRLLKRRDISRKKKHGEAQSSDFQASTDWLKDVWPQLRERYSSDDIFNCDETGLYYRMWPDTTLSYKHDTSRGFKKVKDRITVLVTASMTGEKKRPLIIGKSHNPRCFKNIKTFPTDYYSQRKGWMTSELYSRYLKGWDSQLRAQNRKILLLHDNCPAHNKVEEMVRLTNIELQFLPPNTTAILQGGNSIG